MKRRREIQPDALAPELWQHIYSWLTFAEASRVEQASRECKTTIRFNWQDYLKRDYITSQGDARWPVAYDICQIEKKNFKTCYQELRTSDISVYEWDFMADTLGRPFVDAGELPPMIVLKELSYYETKAAMTGDVRHIVNIAEVWRVMNVHAPSQQAIQKRDAYVDLAIRYVQAGLRLPDDYYAIVAKLYKLREDFEATDDYLFILKTGVALGSFDCFVMLCNTEVPKREIDECAKVIQAHLMCRTSSP